MRVEPAWWAEARRLRADGLTLAASAERFAVTVPAVCRVVKGRRSRVGERAHVAPRLSLRGGALTDAAFVAPRAPRTIRRIIDESALNIAAIAFVRGEIDRAELMRRIAPSAGAPPC